MFKDKYGNDIEECSKDGCDVTVYQDVDLSVPITVEPYVDLGEAIIECIEEPCLIPIPCGAWNKKSKCKFCISQKLCIMIPIEFKVDALSGPVSVNCPGQEEEEEECPPYICCGIQQRPTFVCREEAEHPPDMTDFYYYIKNRVGKLKE
jgi:hypothetical protein